MTGSDSKLFGRHVRTLPLVPACSLILLALQSFAVSAVNAADFSYPVVSILDGDTIEVRHNNRAGRIRLISECLASPHAIPSSNYFMTFATVLRKSANLGLLTLCLTTISVGLTGFP